MINKTYRISFIDKQFIKKGRHSMTTKEKLIKLASMMPQIEKIEVPAYMPMAKELKQLKETLQLIASILTDQEGVK